MEHGFHHPERGYWQTIGEPPEEILSSYPEGTIEVPLRPSPDHAWQDGAWVYVEPAPTPQPVPASVTMRQAKLELLHADLLDQANAAIAALPGIEGEADRIEWAHGATLDRAHPLVARLGAELGLSESDIDELFIAAAAR